MLFLGGSFQLGPVTPYLIQAKHTSAIGQIESVNFTIKPAFMDQGCHVEASDPFSSCIQLILITFIKWHNFN